MYRPIPYKGSRLPPVTAILLTSCFMFCPWSTLRRHSISKLPLGRQNRPCRASHRVGLTHTNQVRVPQWPSQSVPKGYRYHIVPYTHKGNEPCPTYPSFMSSSCSRQKAFASLCLTMLENSPTTVFNQHLFFFLGSKITKQKLLKSEEKRSGGHLGNREINFQTFLSFGKPCYNEREIPKHSDPGAWEQDTQCFPLEMEEGVAGEFQTSKPGLHAWGSSRKKLWGY